LPRATGGGPLDQRRHRQRRLHGHASHGESFVIAGIDIHVVRDGKLAEPWHVVEQLAQMQQMGLIPAPEAVGA